MTSTNATPPRHARLFELIRQHNLAAERSRSSQEALGDLNDAQAFIEAARKTLTQAA